MKAVISFFEEFVRAHWGDLIGVWLISTGILVLFLAPHYFRADQVVEIKIMGTGDSLIAAGLIALKLKAMPPTNGRESEDPQPENKKQETTK